MTEVSYGTATAVVVPRGALLVVSVGEGRQVADLAVDGMEQALTRNAAGWRRFGRPSLALSLTSGDALVDGDGAVILVVEEPGPGALDACYPGCWSELYPDGRPGCRDLLAAALDSPRRALGGVISAFGAVPRLEHGGLHGWEGVACRPGDRLTLRATRDCRVAVSACPDDGIPGADPGRLDVHVTA